MTKKRLVYISKWSTCAKEFADQERTLHENLPEHLKGILRGKRLLLMGETRKDAGYPDHKLVLTYAVASTYQGGFRNQIFCPRETKRPEHGMNTVLLMSKGLNKMILEEVASQAGTALAEKTWESTKDELEKGRVWLDRLSNIDGVILAKRFGLEQKTKLRVIDDYTIGGCKKTCGSLEKLRIHAIDELVAFIAWTMSSNDVSSVKKMVGRSYSCL